MHPELRKSYEYLIDYYKKNNDLVKELRYVKQLLKIDSLLHVNYRNINLKIYKEYETPKLINKKNDLIKSMANDNKISTWVIFLLFIGSLFLTSFLFINYRKRKIYHKRYIAIIEKNRSSNTAKKKIENKSYTNSSIPKNIVDDIMNGLEKFENEKGFTKANLNSSNLASKLNTNTKYLSKVIKIKTGKTYTQYLNDIRIDYAIEKIQSDSIFRNYTIQAIAESVGFNTAEVFSKYFYKKTGIYPSYFVKEAIKTQY